MTLLVLICYLSVLMFLGFAGYKKTKTFKDYIIGGRKLGSILGAMNVGASDMSSWLLMGLPGAFYMIGMNRIWIVIGLVIGSYASWKLIAPRLRVYSEFAKDSLTISSFLENRFNDKTNILKIISAIIILFFFTVYIASGFVGSAKLLSTVFEINYSNALLISSILIIFYAVIGGFFAISWADLAQGILILIVLLLVPAMVFFYIGGGVEVLSIIKTNSPSHLSIFNGLDTMGIVALLGWGLGYFGQPHIISKYMSIKNTSEIKIATRICITWMSLSMIAAGAIGMVGYAFFLESQTENHEAIFIILTKTLFSPFFVGLIIAAILSAIMSTINGQIIISAGILTEDFYKKFIRKRASNAELLTISRSLVIFIASIAVIIAKDEASTVLSLVGYAWSGLGAAIGPIVLCALFWKKTTNLAAIFGIVSGGCTSVLFSEWQIFSYELFPSFIISLLVIIVVSLLQNKKPSKETEAIFAKLEKIK